MSTKREEERNEKIIRGLMKLPPNRRCINCNSLGPQYVCTNFWTFVCIACSGIHREFTHRVKSVSMAKFTTPEVEALQKGGNQRARELFLQDWDTPRMRLPENSNPDRIREFIKAVYVDKKYAGSKSSDKPPRDKQSHKGEEDHRRASSYHSFSQSPPYDHQYEERRYGRQAGILTRKPGSDHGHYEGKLGSFLYSPGRQAEQMYEDRFANESSGPRMSDYSVSSDPFRNGGQSPNFPDPGYGSSPSQAKDIIVEDTGSQNFVAPSESVAKEDMNKISNGHRNASSGSFGSLDGNSISLKSATSGSLIDFVIEPNQVSGIQPAEALTSHPSQQISAAANTTEIDFFGEEFMQSQKTVPHISSAANATKVDLFNREFVQSKNPLPQISSAASDTKNNHISQEFVQPPNTFLAPSIDMFGDLNHQTSAIPPNGQTIPAVPLSENQGWASFEFLHHAEPVKASQELSPVVLPGEKDASKGSLDLFSSMHSNSDWLSVQNPPWQGSSLAADQWSAGFNEVQNSTGPKNSQLWNAFYDSTGNVPQTLSAILPSNNGSQDLMERPQTSVDPYAGVKSPEAMFKNGFPNLAVDDKAPVVASLTGMADSLFPPSAIPQMGRTTLERRATNPFDITYDADSVANNVFLDMSSLQATLPDPQLPATFLGGVPETWFPQNTLTSFGPPVPQGGLAYIGGQVQSAQLQNIPSQGPVASYGGNPFA